MTRSRDRAILDPQVSAGEKTAGTETALRTFSPADVASMASTHGGGEATTYEVLSANGDVGTSAGQVAIGNHTHSGYVATSGSTMTGALRLNDNVLLELGNSADGELYYNGTRVLMDLNAGSDSFRIRDGTTVRFTFADTGAFTATGDVTAYSDIRVKSNIEVIPNALDKVTKLRGVTYNRTDMQDVRQTGLIAQELQLVLPEAVHIGDDEDKTLSIAYGNVVGLLVEAIKELRQEINILKGDK